MLERWESGPFVFCWALVPGKCPCQSCDSPNSYGGPRAYILSHVMWTLVQASCHLDSTEICIPFKICFANYCAKNVAGYNYVGSAISLFVRNLIKSWNWAEAWELLPLFANNISPSGKRDDHNHDLGNHDFSFVGRPWSWRRRRKSQDRKCRFKGCLWGYQTSVKAGTEIYFV